MEDTSKPDVQISARAWTYINDMCDSYRRYEALRLRRVFTGELNYIARQHIVYHCFSNFISPRYMLDALWLNDNCTEVIVRQCRAMYDFVASPESEEIRYSRGFMAYNHVVGHTCSLNRLVLQNSQGEPTPERPLPDTRGDFEMIEPTRRIAAQNWNFIAQLISTYPAEVQGEFRARFLLGLLKYRDRLFIVVTCYANFISPRKMFRALFINESCTIEKATQCYRVYKYLEIAPVDPVLHRNYAYNHMYREIRRLNETPM